MGVEPPANGNAPHLKHRSPNQLVLSEFKQSKRPWPRCDVVVGRLSVAAGLFKLPQFACTTAAHGGHIYPDQGEEDDSMETVGRLYEDGSEAEGPCVFLASFSGDCLRDSCNIITLCNHMWIKAPYNLTMTPAFPSKVYRT